MRQKLRPALLLLLASLPCTSSIVDPSIAIADESGTHGSSTASNVTVALLAGAPQSGTTEVFLVGAEAARNDKAPRSIGMVAHAPGGVVRGATSADGTVFVTATKVGAPKDLSFAAELFALRAGQPAHSLGGDIAHATRPFVHPSGRVFVSRGTAGPSSAQATRIDELRIDAIDPATGAATTLLQYSGFALFIAGVLDDELIVYRVGKNHADLIAVDVQNGTTRALVASMVPFARDFSIDAQRRVLVFQQRHATNPKRWQVQELSLSGPGAPTVLWESDTHALIPHAWPGGQVMSNTGGDLAPHLISGGANVPLFREPGTGGALHIRATEPTSRWLAGLATHPSKLPTPVLVDAKTGHVLLLRTIAGARVDVAGFMTGSK